MDTEQLSGILTALGARPGRYLVPIKGSIYELAVEHQHEGETRRVTIALANRGGLVDMAELLGATVVEAPPVALPQLAPPLDMLTKTCCVCHEEKPLGSFGYNRRMPDGRQPRCFACHNGDMAQRRKARPEPAATAEQAEQSKLCSACGEHKPLSEFGVNNGTPDGHQRTCKPCYNAGQVAKRAARRAQQPEQQASEVAADEAPF